MKLKTVGMVCAVAFVFVAVFAFLRNETNQAILYQELYLFGFAFTVARCLVVLALGSALLPALYFSYRIMSYHGYVRGLETDQQHGLERDHEVAEGADLVRHGSFSVALEVLGEATGPNGVAWRGRALLATGRAEQAATLLSEAFEREAGAEIGYLLVESLEACGGDPESVLRRLIEMRPKVAYNAYLKLLKRYEVDERWLDCLELARGMERSGIPAPEGAIIAYRYEWVNTSAESIPKRKVEQYQQILKDAPDFVPANLSLGDCYMEMGAVEKAFRVYEQAFEKTRNTVFLDRLEAYYLGQGRPEDAIGIYRQLMVRDGGVLIKYQLGKLYYQMRVFDEAYALLHPLRDKLNDMPELLHMLAHIELRTEPEEAFRCLEQVVQQLGGPRNSYQCTGCETRHETWQARCDSCGHWDTIRLKAFLASVESANAAPLYY